MLTCGQDYYIILYKKQFIQTREVLSASTSTISPRLSSFLLTNTVDPNLRLSPTRCRPTSGRRRTRREKISSDEAKLRLVMQTAQVKTPRLRHQEQRPRQIMISKNEVLTLQVKNVYGMSYFIRLLLLILYLREG